MPKKTKKSKAGHKAELLELQIELVKLQKYVIAAGERVLIVVEGRDAGGKDGVIKRVIEHLSPRETRVVALGKPSDRERTMWYFQRFVPHLPAAEEIVFFNRSWYNRAGGEPVMGFCTRDEHPRLSGIAEIFSRLRGSQSPFSTRSYSSCLTSPSATPRSARALTIGDLCTRAAASARSASPTTV